MSGRGSVQIIMAVISIAILQTNEGLNDEGDETEGILCNPFKE